MGDKKTRDERVENTLDAKLLAERAQACRDAASTMELLQKRLVDTEDERDEARRELGLARMHVCETVENRDEPDLTDVLRRVAELERLSIDYEKNIRMLMIEVDDINHDLAKREEGE